MSVREAQQRIDSAEFNEWQAYYSLEPFGEQVNDIRHGIAVSTLANINRDPARRSEVYKPSDFIPWSEERQEQADAGPILLEDPGAQASLIKAALFGMAPQK